MAREGGEKGDRTEGQEGEYGTFELPLYSAGGVNYSRTMKIKGGIEGTNIVSMIDSGASHNFIAKKLFDKMNLEVDDSMRFGLYLWDGCRVSCKGVC